MGNNSTSQTHSCSYSTALNPSIHLANVSICTVLIFTKLFTQKHVMHILIVSTLSEGGPGISRPGDRGVARGAERQEALGANFSW